MMVESKNFSAVKEIRDRRISELEAEVKKREDKIVDLQKGSQGAEKLKKAEEDLKIAQSRADRGMAMASDAYRAVEAQQKKMEALEKANADADAKAKEAIDREAAAKE